jgi:hypothetical protein
MLGASGTRGKNKDRVKTDKINRKERWMMEFPIRMDRSIISFGTAEKHDKEDRLYWQNASDEEKLMTITYLRECFYGPKATTGRLQRFYKVLKRK